MSIAITLRCRAASRQNGVRAADTCLATATLPIVGLGARVEAEGARASVGSLSLHEPIGVDDFSFATLLTVTFVAPASGLPDAVVAGLAPVPATLPLTAVVEPTVDVIAHLLAPELHLDVTLVGAPPAPDFMATLSACLDVDGVVIDD